MGLEGTMRSSLNEGGGGRKDGRAKSYMYDIYLLYMMYRAPSWRAMR